MESAQTLRASINGAYLTPQSDRLPHLIELANLTAEQRERICNNAAALVTQIRETSDPGLMEVFLAEYGLSTEEGIALMCLAEALLRVPDAETIDALIEDKIAPSDWGKHLGHSTSSLVNASTWGLMLTGKVLADQKPGPVGHLRNAIKRLGEPVIRKAVARAMKEMGRQFVLGETIKTAMDRAAGMEKLGFTYSYDMLGEAARTDADARGYHLAYSRAISAIAENCKHASVAENPGISVKLSALHPRYEVAQKDRVMSELVPRLRSLALLAKSAGQGFNIDAEEADRLDLSLDVIEAVVSDPALKGWDGFGVVVQAFGPRASFVLDWLYDLSEWTGQRLMVRLVKGAYWDAEIKRAQVLGLDGFPVFTSKAATDVSYIANARKLLSMTDRIYPQFATHNAHTVHAILEMADGMNVAKDAFEFQRLHGMGEVLHKLVMKEHGTRCRIYAPVGAHADLLAYLVRRLLENGANSSFVNQIVDEDVPAHEVAADPFAAIEEGFPLPIGPNLFEPNRANSKGWDITHMPTLGAIDAKRDAFADTKWTAVPLTVTADTGGITRDVINPAIPADTVGQVTDASSETAQAALNAAAPWDQHVHIRAEILRRVADAYEANAEELFALLHREAGKSLLDAVGEVREAVDFLRYYASEADKQAAPARGRWVCISPWNFPLAIFTGQIAAALATGNAVLAKPAEQTCLIAARAVALMHEVGVPREALQLLPGAGDVGAALTSSPLIDGVAFTGSTETARLIRAAMAENARPGTPLIAETGGLNAMIVDSTALPEHAVRDILQSAFQSAGQRCSALRCLYVQSDVEDTVLEMLKGAMKELRIGNPWDISTDVGPVIDDDARAGIIAHIDAARAKGSLLFELDAPTDGTFVAPAVIRVKSIKDLEKEIFGPVLHIATFDADELSQVMEDINTTGYGLTFGLHTRIDDRVQEVVETMKVGNMYVNRNQIGAVVGSQPFGGEGLSGTGPKAGGPNYLTRFTRTEAEAGKDWAKNDELSALLHRIETAPGASADVTRDLPGPTGESNRLNESARGPILCLGPDRETVERQVQAVLSLGGIPIRAEGSIDPAALTTMNVEAVLWWGDEATGRDYERALAKRDGPLIPLVTDMPDMGHIRHERHVCVDTTAAGGNAALLAEVSNA